MKPAPAISTFATYSEAGSALIKLSAMALGSDAKVLPISSPDSWKNLHDLHSLGAQVEY